MSTIDTAANARYWYLENNRDGHKFYEVWVFGNTCILTWGRIGTEGQSKPHSFNDADEALAKALAQVYAKRGKGYELYHDDLVVPASMDSLQRATTGNVFYLRRDTLKAIEQGDATPRDVALNYIEGFVDDCNEFLARAKGDGYSDSEMERAYEDLNERWAELKDKFDSAETMMHMVTTRTLGRV